MAVAPTRVGRFGLVALVASPAHAVDGVVELNQTCATQTGCLTGDAPGFPITIGTSGSYRLTSNLVLADTNTHGLSVGVDDVAVDLNGFAIRGPIVCNGTPLVCTPNTGTGTGINAQSFRRITVHDGRVTGMGATGLVLGDDGLVSRVIASSNRLDGIVAGAGSSVSDCSASDNGATGIKLSGPGVVRDSASVGNGFTGITLILNGVVRGNAVTVNGGTGITTGLAGIISGNTVRDNVGSGITAGSAATITDNGVYLNDGNGIAAGSGSSVQRNTVSSNGGVGLSFSVTTSGYRDNVITSNTGGTVLSGTNLGNNLCNGSTTCP